MSDSGESSAPPPWRVLVTRGAVSALSLGVAGRLAFERGSSGATAALVTIAVGALALCVMSAFAPDSGTVEGEPFADGGEPIPEKRFERQILAAMSGAVALTGVALLLFDAMEATADRGWTLVVLGTTGLTVAGVWTAAVSAQPRDALVAPPPARSRRPWIALAVLGLLAAQVAVPATYYLGDDIYDERFSWRMFSAVRVARCNLSAFETQDGTETQTNLMQTIHVAWVTTMRRNLSLIHI